MTDIVTKAQKYFTKHGLYDIEGVSTRVKLIYPDKDVSSISHVVLEAQVDGEPKSAVKLVYIGPIILDGIVQIIPSRNSKPDRTKLRDLTAIQNFIVEHVRQSLIEKSVKGDDTVKRYWGTFNIHKDKGPDTSEQQAGTSASAQTTKGKKKTSREDTTMRDDETGEEFFFTAEDKSQQQPLSPIIAPMHSPDLSVIESPQMQLNRDIVDELRKLNGVVVNLPPQGLPRLPANMDARSLQDALEQGYMLMKLEQLASTRENPVQFAGHVISKIDPDGRMDYVTTANIRMKAQDIARNGFNPDDLIQLSRDIMEDITKPQKQQPEQTRARFRGHARNLAIAKAVREPSGQKRRSHRRL